MRPLFVALALLATTSARAQEEPVGLSLLLEDGSSAPLRLVGTPPRYVQELDLVARASTETDEGIAPLMAAGDFASLDWSGVALVEETWNAAADGTFTRQRSYRGAAWMEAPSHFQITPVDARGRRAGAPLVARAGRDDRARPSDDAFVRRFNARQLALGCPAVDDCEGAVFLAEGLAQLRQARHPERAAVVIPDDTVALRVRWSADPARERSMPVQHVPREDTPFGYGFAVHLELASAPANGAFFLPGETVSLRVSFEDGEGNRLHAPGSLPTYGELLRGEVDSGLRYLDLGLNPAAYYALKHRESNLLVTVSGPTNQLRTPETVTPLPAFFLPQVPFATTALDGFTSIGQTIPSAAVVFGGFVVPTLWDLPVSDVVTFTVPADAEPGTYVASIKARREFGGEALNRGTTLELQVGSALATSFTATTSCTACHDQRATRFTRILHGVSDRRSCFGCHAPLAVELDNALDVRVHMVHDRSNRFDADVRDCGLCHLVAPSGPARGLLD